MNKIKKITDNPVAELKKIGILAQKDTIRTFDTEGANLLGGKWQKLADATLKRRRKGKKAGRPRILQDTGALKRATTYELPKPKILRWGPDVTGWYGKFHQSEKPRKKLPRRQFLGVSKNLQKMIVDSLGKGIMKHISLEIRG